MDIQDSNFFIFGSLFEHCYWECLDLIDLPNCQFINDTKFTKNPLVWFAYKVHNAGVINKRIPLPGRSLWYSHFFDVKRISQDRTNYFLFFDSNPYVYSPRFLDYLSKKPNAYLVLFFDNCMKMHTFKDIGYFKNHFNQIYTIDLRDSKEYGFTYIEGLLSCRKNKIFDISNDVFFCGRNKGREDNILRVYDILQSKGFSCDFTIVGSNNKRQGINYNPISYDELMKRTMHSKCIFELNNEGQVSYTLRSFQAIMYDKMLITNNPLIEKSSYFDKDKIFVFKNIEEIEQLPLDFSKQISYNYHGDFSPIRLLEQIVTH